MRYQLAIILSLACGPAMADEPVETSLSTAVSANAGPFSVGRPHVCATFYPPAALKGHVEGTTTLDFVVTVQGGVRDIKVSNSSGNKDLDDAAVNCASRWRYKPATKDTVPIEMSWKANVVWKITPLPEVQAALSCLYHRENQPAPPNLGHTAVTFRVMQDGSVTDVKVTQSSGYGVWDDVGTACAQARHFDMSNFTIPSDGLPGHMEMDWKGALATLAPPATLPPPTSGTSGNK